VGIIANMCWELGSSGLI